EILEVPHNVQMGEPPGHRVTGPESLAAQREQPLPVGFWDSHHAADHVERYPCGDIFHEIAMLLFYGEVEHAPCDFPHLRLDDSHRTDREPFIDQPPQLAVPGWIGERQCATASRVGSMT